MTDKTFLQNLLSLPTVLNAKLSPDGRLVAFEWYRVHENVDIFLVRADGSSAPQSLTHTPEETKLVSWTQDSRALVLSEDHDGDERARLFRLEVGSPGEMQPLTEDRPPYFIRGGQISPLGTVLFYGANYDFERDQAIEPTWIYRHDLQTGERTAIAKPIRPAYTLPELNRAGTRLIYSRQDRHPAGRQIHMVDVNGHEDREILNFGDRDKVVARWLPDSENILVVHYMSHAVVREGEPQATPPYVRLGIYHWPSEELRWLIDDAQRAIEDAWVSPDGLVVVDEVVQANHTTVFLQPDSGLESKFPAFPGNLLPLGRASDGDWVARYYAATAPPELVRFSTGEPLRTLTHVWERTELQPFQLAPAESFHWQSVDGMEVQGWLYRAEPNPRRAILFVHGGPTYHSEDRLNPQIQYFIARGFNVLDVNYRGSTGFGLPYRESIKEDGWGGREQSDIAAGAQALIDAGLADPGRVGVTGTSYGGYSSWFQITHAPVETIAAAAPICGMTDLVVDYETTRPDLRPYSEEMLGGSPDEVPERYHVRSPINFVQDIRGRLLIVQGAQDPNVTPENVRQVVERLEAEGISYELLVFEDEGHGIHKPENQEELYTRLAVFFERALK